MREQDGEGAAEVMNGMRWARGTSAAIAPLHGDGRNRRRGPLWFPRRAGNGVHDEVLRLLLRPL